MSDLYSQLCTCSKRAIRRKNRQFGHTYTYRPRGNLLARLASQNGITVDEAYRQLMELRAELLSEQG